MNYGDRSKTLQEATKLMLGTLRDLQPLVAAIEETKLGHPRAGSSASEGSGHTSVTDDRGDPMPSVSDPVGEAGIRTCPGRAELASLDRHLQAIYAGARAVEAIRSRYLDVVVPSEGLEGEEGCEIVARVRRYDGQPHWEEVYRESTVSGNLRREYRLGRWAYEFVRRSGRIPTLGEISAHVEGRKVRAG